jgi:hypothetical protein
MAFVEVIIGLDISRLWSSAPYNVCLNKRK